VRWTAALFAVGWWLAVAGTIGERVIRPLQTISNLLAALREGDYSIRARGARTDEALGLALFEVNALADVLRGQRLGALEATALLRRVIAEVDVAIFTFDQDQRLRLINRAGERFLGQAAARTLERTAGELGLAPCLEGEVPRTVELPFGGRLGRWEIRRSAFRQDGRPHQLVVLSDLSRALREEERQAWQRLIRVLGHEINNSLAPIRSIANSLAEALDRGGPGGPGVSAESAADFRRGLAVIAARSESLSRFMAAYSRLARLPRPKLAPVDLAALMRRVVGLETRLSVRIASESALWVTADADQLEQLLINLVSNGVDAALETGLLLSPDVEPGTDGLDVALGHRHVHRSVTVRESSVTEDQIAARVGHGVTSGAGGYRGPRGNATGGPAPSRRPLRLLTIVKRPKSQGAVTCRDEGGGGYEGEVRVRMRAA